MTNYLRPDEQVTESEIRKAQGRSNELKSGLQIGASLGTASLGKAAASKILPFLSEHIPTDLAFKGINKVVPGLGNFLKNGMSQGLSLKSGLDFLKKEFTKQPQDNRNIIEQYSPELHQFLQGEIQKGRQPIEAGALAQLKKEFKDPIEKLTKDHKSPFSALLQTVYGGQEQNQPQQQMQQQAQSQGQQGMSDQQILQKISETLKL